MSAATLRRTYTIRSDDGSVAARLVDWRLAVVWGRAMVDEMHPVARLARLRSMLDELGFIRTNLPHDQEPGKLIVRYWELTPAAAMKRWSVTEIEDLIARTVKTWMQREGLLR